MYDQREFAWTDAGFQAPPLASGVVYELHLGTFTPEGTLDAAADRLGYLAELGVTHVELMPVAAFDGRYGWGYDAVALYAVHEPYGGPDALKRFVMRSTAKAWPCCWMWCTTISGRAGITPANSGPMSWIGTYALGRSSET